MIQVQQPLRHPLRFTLHTDSKLTYRAWTQPEYILQSLRDLMAWACPMAQHATRHGQASSVPAEGTGGGHGPWHRALGTGNHMETWHRAPSAWLLAAGRRSHRVLDSGFIPVSWHWDMNVLTSQWHLQKGSEGFTKPGLQCSLAVDSRAGQQWWFNEMSLIRINFNAQGRGWRIGALHAQGEFV